MRKKKPAAVVVKQHQSVVISKRQMERVARGQATMDEDDYERMRPTEDQLAASRTRRAIEDRMMERDLLR